MSDHGSTIKQCLRAIDMIDAHARWLELHTPYPPRGPLTAREVRNPNAPLTLAAFERVLLGKGGNKA